MPTTSSPWASPSSPAGRRLLQSEPATVDGLPVLDEAALALGAALVALAPPSSSDRPPDPAGVAALVAAVPSAPAPHRPSSGDPVPGAVLAAAVPSAPSADRPPAGAALAVPDLLPVVVADGVPPTASMAAPWRSARRRGGPAGRGPVVALAPSRPVICAPTAGPITRDRRPGSDRCRPRRGVVARRGLVAVALVVGVLAAGATGVGERPAPATAGPEPAPSVGRVVGFALGAEVSPPVAGGEVVVGLIDPTDAVGATPGRGPGPTLAERLGRLVVLAAEDVASG